MQESVAKEQVAKAIEQERIAKAHKRLADRATEELKDLVLSRDEDMKRKDQEVKKWQENYSEIQLMLEQLRAR